MTRPLALIEGDLTIPLPRPFDGLPPPFGSRHRGLREAVHRAVSEIADPARARRFPPGVKHVLFYKAPPQRVHNYGFDAAMAEAKRYLEMGKVRPRSSRSDHILAGAIFTGCTIALTWLLVTCSMKDAEKTTIASATSAVAGGKAKLDAGKPRASSIAALASVASAPPVSADAPSKAEVAQLAPASRGAISPKTPQRAVQPLLAEATPAPPVAATRATQVTSRQTVRLAARADSTAVPAGKPAKRAHMARLSEAHIDGRVALNRATQPGTRAAPSMQPEWTATASRSHDDAANDGAPWLNWSAQQQHARPAPTVRAAVPVPGDNTWNDHMTQRRITDDPAAFHVNRGAQ
ncbi:hypothetical protein [Paraburkholderia sp.]|uniref:hypothetical protein n=1 Tax=Paraburkholderia sp. TaxID=1926495 RepID=UPI002F40772F